MVLSQYRSVSKDAKCKSGLGGEGSAAAEYERGLWAEGAYIMLVGEGLAAGRNTWWETPCGRPCPG